MKKLLRYFLLLIFAVAVAGCRESDERRHPLYIKALQDQQNGKGQDAADKLSELLKRRPRSAYTHKLLASIYDEMLNEPANAVYHYQAYLQAMPEAADAEEVKAWCTQAEKRCYEALHERFGKATEAVQPKAVGQVVAEVPATVTPGTLPAAAEKTPLPPDNALLKKDEIIAAKDKEITELKQKLSQYQTSYNAMRKELEKLRAQLTQRTQPVAAVETKKPVSKSNIRQYKVVSGDTPGGIARKVYGKSSLYYLIMRANPQVDARRLRPGMILNIPQYKEKSEQENSR